MHSRDQGEVKMPNSTVLVMLASYNGETYIAEQIDSILAQQNVDVSLLIRDDGSTDGTLELLDGLYGNYSCVKIIKDEGNLGSALSFMNMLYRADSAYDYYAFSDQDDYWKPNHLSQAIQCMQEASAYPSQSMLYCCNREEVDANKEFLYHNVPIEDNERYKSLDHLLYVRNVAPGNTMVFSKALLQRLKKHGGIVFPHSYYHDNWVHLVAASLADTIVVYDFAYSGVERRITGNNVAGFDRRRRRPFRSLIAQFNSYPLGLMQEKTSELLAVYGDEIDVDSKKILQLFSQAKSFKARAKLLWRSRTVKFDSIKGRLFNLYKIVTGTI